MERNRNEKMMRPYREFFDWLPWEEPFFRANPSLSKAMQGRTDFTWNPSCEVNEDQEGYHFTFDIPGLKKEDIHLEFNENQLVVSGERKEEKKSDNKKNHFSEILYGSFMRSFTLPSDINAEKVVAEYNDGTLRVLVPREETKKKSQRVQIR